MNISSEVYKQRNDKGMIAFARVNINNEIVLDNIRIMQNEHGKQYLQMPSVVDNNGEFKQIFYPITKEARAQIESDVLGRLNNEPWTSEEIKLVKFYQDTATLSALVTEIGDNGEYRVRDGVERKVFYQILRDAKRYVKANNINLEGSYEKLSAPMKIKAVITSVSEKPNKILARGQIIIDDSVVINNVLLQRGENGRLNIKMPGYMKSSGDWQTFVMIYSDIYGSLLNAMKKAYENFGRIERNINEFSDLGGKKDIMYMKGLNNNVAVHVINILKNWGIPFSAKICHDKTSFAIHRNSLYDYGNAVKEARNKIKGLSSETATQLQKSKAEESKHNVHSTESAEQKDYAGEEYVEETEFPF